MEECFNEMDISDFFDKEFKVFMVIKLLTKLKRKLYENNKKHKKEVGWSEITNSEKMFSLSLSLSLGKTKQDNNEISYYTSEVGKYQKYWEQFVLVGLWWGRIYHSSQVEMLPDPIPVENSMEDSN